MAVEPLPTHVTHVATGWASTADGEVQHASERPTDSDDVRTKCDYCPAFVDGNRESGQVWLQAHVERAHGGSP